MGAVLPLSQGHLAIFVAVKARGTGVGRGASGTQGSATSDCTVSYSRRKSLAQPGEGRPRIAEVPTLRNPSIEHICSFSGFSQTSREVRHRGGEGNGTPLPCSCLESPMDGGAWWSAVHGVMKSRTRLSNFPFTFHFHALEKEMETHSSVLAWRIPGTGEPGGLPSVGSHRVGHD